jgi:ABC-type Fe3+/spermidine/putrescine transport system ATPase subunit
MNKGQIVQQGSIVDLRERPSSAFVSDFLNAQRQLVEV